MSKRAIRHSFDRAAGRYDAAAALQREVGGLLLAALPELTLLAPHARPFRWNSGSQPPTGGLASAWGGPAPTSPAAILDAGCGTGHGLRLLSERWPQARLVAADFAPAMLASAQGGRVCADIESLPFADGSFDLYWSSLAFQWCDARRAAAEAARVLAPGGRFAASSLAPGTLAELAAAFDGIDRHRHVLDFAPAEALAKACAAAGFRDVALATRTLRRHHADLRSLLAALKALGANQLAGRRPGLMGRRAWQTVEMRYEALREPAGLPATWEVVLCTATL